MIPIGAILLFVLLVLLFFFNYKINGGIYSPAVQLCGMYMISCLSFMINASNWHADLLLQTILSIIWAILCFSLGEYVLSSIKIKKIHLNWKWLNSIKISECIKGNVYIPKKVFIILSVISFITFVLHFDYTRCLALAAGNKYGLSQMINFAYYAKYNLEGMPDESFFVTLGLVCSHVFACISLLVYTLKAINREYKGKNLIYLIPVLLYIAQVVLNGGRTAFLRIIIFEILLTLSLLYFKSGSFELNFKIIGAVIGCVVLFLFIYRFYGILRGSQHSGWNTILAYPGTALQAYNVYLEEPSSSAFFGQETMTTIYHIMNKLGFSLPSGTLSLPSIYWHNGGTNVYTALRRYVADYSYFGAGLIMFLLGSFYGALKRWMFESKSVLATLLYAYLAYPVIEFIFEERFMIGVVSAGTVYYIIMFILLQHILKTGDPVVSGSVK